MRNTTFPVKRGEVCVWYPLLVVSTAAGIHYCWSWSGGVSHVKYFATYGWLKGLVTIFNPHLMDLSYLILKETTANNRTVRTQHILVKQFATNNGRSLLNPNPFHVNLSLHLTEVISIMTHIFVNFNNDTYFCYLITSYVRPPVHKHQAKWQRHTIFLCYFSLLFNQQAQFFFHWTEKGKAFCPFYLKRNIN